MLSGLNHILNPTLLAKLVRNKGQKATFRHHYDKLIKDKYQIHFRSNLCMDFEKIKKIRFKSKKSDFNKKKSDLFVFFF